MNQSQMKAITLSDKGVRFDVKEEIQFFGKVVRENNFKLD
jgi:hypothetical protein